MGHIGVFILFYIGGGGDTELVPRSREMKYFFNLLQLYPREKYL